MQTDDSDVLTNVITPEHLRLLAGDRYFDRGKAYFADGAVRSLAPSGNGVAAVVQGTRRYRARLWVQDGGLCHDCTCPLGRDGEFCKHCVAVGLACCIDGTDGNTGMDAGQGEAGFVEPAWRAFLLELDKEELVTLILDHADENQRLRQRLMIRAAQKMPGTSDMSVWKRAFNEAVTTEDFVDYWEAEAYASGIEEVIESLEGFLLNGRAENAIGLAEYGLTELEQTLEYVDDSDGWLGGLLCRLQELHLDACRLARPDPVELAQRLFESEMNSSFDVFHRAAFVYADVLGEAGLAAYSRLAEAEWAKVRSLGPGDEDPERYGGRFRITSVMEALAESAGDLEALVAVKSRDLSTPYAFLQIANLYHEAGDPDRALDWAERGWRAFAGEQPDERLRTFIADYYQTRGRRDEAMALIWDAFLAYPCLDTYRQLEEHGRRASQWPAWRDRALTEIRQRTAEKTGQSTGTGNLGYGQSTDQSLLVEIFLHEGDLEAAWREAETGGCSRRLWLELAKRRQRTHPEDSIRVYQAHVASLLRNTGDTVYEEAIRALEKIRSLLVRGGNEFAFETIVGEVRATHCRKRKLMLMLARKGW